MAFTLSIEDLLVYAVCSRRYITKQSLAYIESAGMKGLPCVVKAVVGGEITFVGEEKFHTGGKNIYAYDPKNVADWLTQRGIRYNQMKKNLHQAEKLVGEFAKEMEDIANG